MDCLRGTKSQSGSKIPSRSDLRGRVPARADHRKKRTKSQSFIFATWNVRTLLDSNTSERPERRTALIAHELRRLNIDIAALSETRFLGEGSLVDGDYTFFWKGLPDGSKKLHGVGLAIKNSLANNLTEHPCGISERLMTWRYQLPDETFVNVISAYAPTLADDQPSKDAFYTSLENTLKNIPKNDRVLLLGDFNARVGRQSDVWPGVLGSNGVGNVNSNGELLLQKCAEHDLVITNTVFRQRNKFKGTWKHPRSGHWHMIDFVIVRRRDLRDVKCTKARVDVECWTDHRLVVSKLQIGLKPRRQIKRKQQHRARMDVGKLKTPESAESLRTEIQSRLSQLDNAYTDADNYWEKLNNEIKESCELTVGFTNTNRKNDWFAENHPRISNLLEEKHKAYQKVVTNPNDESSSDNFKSAKNNVRQKIRTIKNEWWINKANQIQHFADQHDHRNFFQAVKEIYGPIHRKSCPIRDVNGNLLRHEADIRSRWRDHYSSILNQDSEVDYSIIDAIPQFHIATHLDNEISTEEILTAINHLKNNKSPGNDGIPSEVYKTISHEVVENLKTCFNLIWKTGVVPRDFRDALIINVYKNKGSTSDCGNYRGISLLSVGGKILTSVMARRLVSYVEMILPESQSGFRPTRGTTDSIFSLRQLQEKVVEQQASMYVAFVDLTKAFDSIDRTALWQIMKRFGVPPLFVNVCEGLHKNNLARVIHNGETTEPFSTHTGVRQGCVLAPILFNIFAAAVVVIVDNRLQERGLGVRYRFEGGLFNLKRLRAKTRTKYVTELQYADDCALIGDTSEHLQEILSEYACIYDALGLHINVNKTKIMSIPHNLPHHPISVKNKPLEYVHQFNYLGSIMDDKAVLDSEIQSRLNAASRAYWRLKERVFNNHDLSIKTKIAVYRAVILPTLTYGCETWVPYKRHIKTLERCQQRHLRQIMKIKWFHKISNTEVLNKANCVGIGALVGQSRLRWLGHLRRMSDNRLPKCILYGELQVGQRKQGGPLKRFKDVLHEDLKVLHIQNNWEELAVDRSNWRKTIKNYRGVVKPQRRNVGGPFECPECGRIITSQIGLFSHRRTHKSRLSTL